MANSHKKHLTDRSTCKIMKKYANRKIRQISVYSDIPNHKYFRRISNPYRISDDYCFGWSEDFWLAHIAYTINRKLEKTEFNENIQFRHYRNK